MQAEPTSHDDPAPDLATSYFRVLYVEESPLVQQALASSLGRYGFEVLSTCHPRSALLEYQALRGRFVAVVFCHDIPGMDGVGFARSLRDLGYRRTIVVVSAHLTPEELWEYRPHGIIGFLHKAFATETLAAMLLQNV